MKIVDDCSTALVLAPHADDGELGCGGTIARLTDQGTKVFYAAFSTAGESVPKGFPSDILAKEVIEAVACLGVKRDNLVIYDYRVRRLNFSRQEILESLIKLRKEIDPQLVFIPALSDIHQDHATVAMEGLRAFKRSTVLSYELPWNNMSFNHQCYVELQEDDICRKVAAIDKYKSQAAKDYMSKDSVYALAKVRGVQVGRQYAECFEVTRLVI